VQPDGRRHPPSATTTTPRADTAPGDSRRPFPAGIAAAVALLGIGLAVGAPTAGIAWAAVGMMLGAAATAGAARGDRLARSSRAEPEKHEKHEKHAEFDAPAPDPRLTAGLIAAAETSSDVIRLLDADGRIGWVNRAGRVRCRRQSGLDVGQDAFSIAAGYRLDDGTRTRLQADLDARVGFSETLTVHTAAGRAREVDVRGRPIRGTDGEFTGWVVIERDITDEREKAGLLDLLLDASRAGMWDWDIALGTVRTTPNVHAMIDEAMPPGPVTMEWFTARVHPEDQDVLMGQLDSALANDRNAYEVVFRFGREGHWRWIRTAGRVIERDAEGMPRRMIGLHIDLDEMHRSLIAVRETTQLLHEIIDLVPVRIAWKDRDGRHLGANLAYRRDHGDVPITDRTDEEIGVPPDEAVRRRDREQQVLQEIATDQELIETWTRADGTAGWRQIACRPLHDAEGTVIGTISSYRDITELKQVAAELERARDQAQEANLAKSEFLANMSHEIRTPMTAILGFADLLGDADEDEEGRARRDEAARTIRRNGDHLLAILNDILDLSKIEAGRMTVESVPVSPAELLGDVRRLMSGRAAGKGLDLRFAWTGPIPAEVRTDPVRLRQILSNIVGNAVKFTETGTVVMEVGYAAADGGRLRIAVRDTGIGMSPDQVAHVFDAFAQADTSTTRRFGGTGLGLRISRSLAEALGGSLTCTSEAGRGSIFTVELPAPAVDDVAWLDPEAAAAAADTEAHARPAAIARPAAATPLAGIRVLLAEDGPDNQRLIGFHLRRAGADIRVVEDGRQAVDAVIDAVAAGFPFDVVLMDVQMPELDGYAATQELRAAGHELPILALTAHAMAGDRERSLDAGCDEHLTKPIDPVRMIDAVLRHAGKNGADGAADRAAA
jgi:two-component system CheB/CheR fusion protein